MNTEKNQAVPKGAAYLITVGEGDNQKRAYLKKPNRATMEIVLGLTMSVSASPQYIRAGEIILTNCWIEGDEEIKTNDDFLIPAAMQAFRAVEMEKGELVKL
jgi:hypothetical protein